MLQRDEFWPYVHVQISMFASELYVYCFGENFVTIEKHGYTFKTFWMVCLKITVAVASVARVDCLVVNASGDSCTSQPAGLHDKSIDASSTAAVASLCDVIVAVASCCGRAVLGDVVVATDRLAAGGVGVATSLPRVVLH